MKKVLVISTSLRHGSNYYEMSGQMKTLLDRANPLYSSDYRFREIYMLTSAAEDGAFVPERAVAGLRAGLTVLRKPGWPVVSLPAA